MKLLLVAGTLLAATGAVAQDRDLAAARDLYASAAYEDALLTVDKDGTPVSVI